MNEEQFRDAILNRLSMKDGNIETALRRFAQLERVIIDTEDPKKLQEEVSKIQSAILKELDQYQFQVEKEQLIYDAYQRDCKNYMEAFRGKEGEIKQVKLEIEELKMKLKNEQQNKRNREEYMTMTKLIYKHPKRTETEKAINEVKKELSTVESRAREITSEFESHSKQFQLVLYAVNMLQEEMATSEGKKRRRTESTETPLTKKQKNNPELLETVHVLDSIDLQGDLTGLDLEIDIGTDVSIVSPVDGGGVEGGESSPVIVEVEEGEEVEEVDVEHL